MLKGAGLLAGGVRKEVKTVPGVVSAGGETYNPPCGWASDRRLMGLYHTPNSTNVEWSAHILGAMP